MVKRIFILVLFALQIAYSQNSEWMRFDCLSDLIAALAEEGNYLWIGGGGGFDKVMGGSLDIVGGGIAKLNKVTGEMVFYKKRNSGLPSDIIIAITIDGQGNKWIGTCGGLVKFDGINWKVYNKANSGLPSDTVVAITIDKQGNKWMGTLRGLAKFDDVNWTVYDTNNSGLPYNVIYTISIDGQGNKWIGTGQGLAKFDGSTWTVWNISNSGLPENGVYTISIDSQGNKWIGTGRGLTKFDGNKWTVYDTSNSGLPNNSVFAISMDAQGNKWIGTWRGLAKFDGANWAEYDTGNSELPSNIVYAISIDGQGNKWIGTYEGLIAYCEGGVSLNAVEKKKETAPKTFALRQKIFNLINNSTCVGYDIGHEAHVRFIVYDILGREVSRLVDKVQPQGRYRVEWKSAGLGNGSYYYRLQAGEFSAVRKMVLVK
jgi:ligand-binding sensor domain-containing protein